MNCRQFIEVASAWLDGELPAGPEAQARAHLAGCADCSRLAEDLAAADRLLSGRSAAERSEAEWEGFGRRLMVRVAAAERERAESGRRGARRLWRLGLGLAGAAAALALAAWTGYELRGDSRPAPAGPGHAPAPAPVAFAELYPSKAGPPALESEAAAAPPPEARLEELQRLLAAAERVLVRLANADPADAAEMAAVREAVVASGLASRLAEVRRAAPAGEAIAGQARAVELVLVRLANAAPADAAELAGIRDAVVDAALADRSRAARF